MMAKSPFSLKDETDALSPAGDAAILSRELHRAEIPRR
jgi:hypothetical protein